MSFDILGAKKAGYSDAEIAQFLAEDKSTSFDVKGALDAGYSPAEVVGELTQHPAFAAGKQELDDAAKSPAANHFTTAMPRDQYEKQFLATNPQASRAALDAVLAQYDQQVAATRKAKDVQGKKLGPKPILSPEQFFDERLNARLQDHGVQNALVPPLPAREQPLAFPGTSTRHRPGVVDQAKGDFGRGIDNLKALGYGAGGLAADASGYDAKADEWLGQYVAIQNDIAKNNPATIGTYKNIHGLGDAGRYAIEAVAENLPMILPSLATGGAGAKLAQAGAQRLVTGMIESQVAKGIAREVAEKNAASFVARRIMMGSAAGAAPATIGMESGSIMGDIYQDTGQKRAGLAVAYGIPAGLLDTLEPVLAMRKIAGPVVDQVAGGIIKRLGVEAGKQFIAEAGTEGLQTILEEAAKTQASGKKLFTPELLDNVIDSALKGGIGGVGMGGISQGVAEARGAFARPVDDGSAAADAARQEAMDRWNTNGLSPRTTMPAAPAPSIADIGAAGSVDEAIAAAQAVVSHPTAGTHATATDIEALEQAAGLGAPELAPLAPAPVNQEVIHEAAPASGSDGGTGGGIAGRPGETVGERPAPAGTVPERAAPVDALPGPQGGADPVRAGARAEPSPALGDGWHAFPAESGTLGIPRADMPQILSEHRGALTQYLKARGIPHEQVEIPADRLKPTQAEFNLDKVQKAHDFTGDGRSILVSSDGHVLDGHHQWLAAVEKGEAVKAIRLDAPIKDLLEQVKEFPSATVAEGAPQNAPQNIPNNIPDAPRPGQDKLDATAQRLQKQDEVVRLAAENIAARKAMQATERAKLDAQRSSAKADASAIVEIKDVYGRTHRVRQADLTGDADRISTIRKNGDVVTGEEIPRSIIKVDPPAAPEKKQTAKKAERAKIEAQRKGANDGGADDLIQQKADEVMRAAEEYGAAGSMKFNVTREQVVDLIRDRGIDIADSTIKMMRKQASDLREGNSPFAPKVWTKKQKEIAARKAADPLDGIPRTFLKKTSVERQAYNAEAKRWDTAHLPADQALKSVREDISNLEAMLKCMKG